jgi:molybdopterin-guanine dinucleotide biosynthesis protein A
MIGDFLRENEKVPLMEMDAAGYVLAGGRSSRMGTEKALVQFDGEPLVVHALRILHNARLAASIAGAHSPLESFAPVVPDSEPDRGPLGGICAALEATKARWVVFLPVDMPLLPASFVTYLLEEAQSSGTAFTVATVDGFAQTFPVVVDRAALPGLRLALESGQRGCYSAFQSAAAGLGQTIKIVPVEHAVKEGKLAHPMGLPVAGWFLNVNRPADLRRAEWSRRSRAVL